MNLFDIIRSFVNKGQTYHIIDRSNNMSVYKGSFKDCLNTLNKEGKGLQKNAYHLSSDKKYSRIIRRKPKL